MRLDVFGRLGFPVLGGWRDLAYAAWFFAAYLVADLATRMTVSFGLQDAEGPVLFFAAVQSNVVRVLGVCVILAVAVVRFPGRWLSSWDDLERGRELRLLAAPLLAVLAWEGALYQYNYLLDRTHLFDRALLVLVALAALRKPILLIPFVWQSRIIAEQFKLPYGTAAAQNIDELLLIVLLAIAGAHLIFVFTGRQDSAPVVLVVCAAVATFFFIPGRGKVLLNWLASEDLSNLASSGYAVGWLGQTDGSVARWLSGVVDTFGLPLRLLTLVVELGAAIVAVNYRWFRLWLPLVIGFHIANFLLLGFWFLAWIVLEVAVVILLTRPQLTEWFGRNLTVGRAALTALAVGLFGAFLFHPPGLAWLDSPVAYGYQIEAIGESGTRYNVPIRSFAPFEQELTFDRLQLGENQRLSGAYGVVSSSDRLRALQEIQNLDELAAIEEPLGPRTSLDQQHEEDFLVSFIAYANGRASGENDLAGVLDIVEPLSKFWTGRPSPRYEFQERIIELEVFQVTSLRTDNEFHHRRSLVLALDQS